MRYRGSVDAVESISVSSGPFGLKLGKHVGID